MNPTMYQPPSLNSYYKQNNNKPYKKPSNGKFQNAKYANLGPKKITDPKNCTGVNTQKA